MPSSSEATLIALVALVTGRRRRRRRRGRRRGGRRGCARLGALLHARRIGAFGQAVDDVFVDLHRSRLVTRVPLRVAETDERRRVVRIDGEYTLVPGARTGEVTLGVSDRSKPGERLRVVRVRLDRRA